MNTLKKRVLPVLAFIVCLSIIGGVGYWGYGAVTGGGTNQSQYQQLTKDNIQTEVGTKGLVYFYACYEGRYACDVQREQFEKFADAVGDQIKVAWIDVAAQPELAQGIGIESDANIPAHFVVLDGKLIAATSGVYSAEEIVALITQALQQAAQTAPAGGAVPATPAP